MSHVVSPNQAVIAIGEGFQAIWKLTRTLLAAGWKYKASGDATGAAKETTGDWSKDRWGVGGGVNITQVGAQTGTAPVIGAASNGNSVLSSVSGFTANSIGRFLVVTGALNSANNGIFRIVAQTGTSVTVWNPGAIAETGASAVTWTEKAGGASASVFASGTAGAIVGRSILTGLTGMVSPTTAPLSRGSVGDRLTFLGAATGANNGTFMITRVISATSVEVDNASATTDVNNGAIMWTESSPTTQVYATHLQGATGTGAWLNLQGPSIMKIPVGANVPTGTFLKGEVINETTSGAQGVILGVCTDTYTGNGYGYVVVEPRLSGTGGGVRGWSITADTITGATSGATIAVPNPTVPIEYVHEMVFWKNVAASGHLYCQVVDGVGESVYRFSTLAGNAGTTATICPGGATGTFPLMAWAALGTGGSNAAGTGSVNWYLNTNQTNLGNFQAICANCIEGSGVSQDGSWIIAQGQPATSPGNYTGMCFMRCDDGEDGDVSPYLTYTPNNATWYSASRTANVTTTVGTDAWAFGPVGGIGNTNASNFKGWRRKGFPTPNPIQPTVAPLPTTPNETWLEWPAFVLGSIANTGTALYATNVVNPGRVATQATSSKFIREPIWIDSPLYGYKGRKGRLRWVMMTEGGTANSTYDAGTWIQLSTSIQGPCVVGPWDGQTVPLNG